MTRRFTANVWLTDSAGNQTFHEMGAPVPDGAPVGDHVWAEVNDDYLADTAEIGPVADADPTSAAFDLLYPGDDGDVDEDRSSSSFRPPPRSGPGATKASWEDYWTVTTESEPPRGWTRDDLIEELRRRQIPVGE